MEREYCKGKNRYDKRGAQTVRNQRMRAGHVKLRVYYCSDCNGWHVTSKT